MAALSDGANRGVQTIVTQIDEMVREGLDNLPAGNHNPLMTGLMAARAALMLTQAAVEIGPPRFRDIPTQDGTLIEGLGRQIMTVDNLIHQLIVREQTA